MRKTDEVYDKAGLVTNALVVFGCLALASPAHAQPPELSKNQRTLLQAVVQAVDDAANQPPLPDSSWPAHVLRASDGSHYVAFAVEPTGDMKLPSAPVMLYVRLATARGSGVTTTPERSAIRDWLSGRRPDPRLLPNRGTAMGEMPTMGATGNLSRRPPGTSGLSDLQLMALDRQRARERQAELDKQRRAALEKQAVGQREMLPFEDFDLASASIAAGGARQITRALTAGPGTYDLYVGWADPTATDPASSIRVLRRSLSLPPATAGDLAISSVIIADDVQARAAPYPSAEQSAHPYAIGATEVTPARDTVFSRDERLAVAFQVINAQPSETGKPDVAVDFRIVRVDGEREVPIASLNPQVYTEATMPADFDLRIGHPLFVAVGAPLATVPRGSHRLKITVTDRRAGVTRLADAAFTVAGTPLSLLSEAPPLGRPFRREDAIDGVMLTKLVQGLTPPSPSPALQGALALAAGGKFVDLLAETTVPAPERAVRAALTGLALYSIGDASALTQFQRAYTLGGPGGPIQFLTGAARAAQNRDAEAIVAWQSAKEEGFEPVVPFLAEAYLRRNDGARAAAAFAPDSGAKPATNTWSRTLAAAHLATGRDAEAIVVLEARLAQEPGDLDAAWLLLQALYGRLVKDGSGDRSRFEAVLQGYIAAGGPNADLAQEWRKVLNGSERF